MVDVVVALGLVALLVVILVAVLRPLLAVLGGVAGSVLVGLVVVRALVALALAVVPLRSFLAVVSVVTLGEVVVAFVPAVQ